MVNLKNVLIVFFMGIRLINTELEGKIIKGQFAKISDFPHAVYLVISCAKVSAICGSSIINQKILLTAAHCFDDCPLKYIQTEAYAGSDNLEQVKILRKAQEIKKHDRYFRSSMANDIALVTVRGTLPLGTYIKRVIIPNRFPPNVDAMVSGWGTVNERTEESSLKLKATYQKVRSNLTCQIKINDLVPGMFCAGGTTDYDRPDTGDSGGGLIVNKVTQIGLVSFRMENLKNLVIYTNVTYFYNWIMTHSRGMYCST